MLTPIVNFRDFHAETHDLKFRYTQKINRDKVQLDFGENKGKINLYVEGAKYKEYIDNIFYSMFYQREALRGFDAEENHAVPGTFEVEIKPNEDKEIVFFCSLDGETGNGLEELQRLSGTKIIENEKKRINEQVKKSGFGVHTLCFRPDRRRGTAGDLGGWQLQQPGGSDPYNGGRDLDR